MKEIVVISGKGGTGKTSITASLAMLAKEQAVVADCDVDAADLHLLLKPNFENNKEFYSGQLAQIDQEKCIQCGICLEKCHFKAIYKNEDSFLVNTLSCEGCGLCEKVCPASAIQMEANKVGHLFISQTKTGQAMAHARLEIGAENSGKLVAEVKKTAKQIATETAKEFVIVDGSPGIGCPVISSLSGAHYVLLVTEPSASGFHDLKRVYELVKKFQIRTGCIINKYDINKEISEQITSFLKRENIELINVIPYDENFTKAMVNGQCIVEYDEGSLQKKIIESWEKIKQTI